VLHNQFVQEMGILLPKLKAQAESNNAAWNPDKESLKVDQHGIGNKILMPDMPAETRGVSDADVDRSLDKTFGVPETETTLPGHKTENINPEVTEATADGNHKLTAAKDGKIYRCSECEQLLSTYQEVLEQNTDLKDILLILEQQMKIADAAERARLLKEQVKPLEDRLRVLEAERVRVYKSSDPDFHSPIGVGRSRRYVDKGGTAGEARRLSRDVTQIETALGQTTIRDDYQKAAIPGGPTAYGVPDGVNGFDRLHAIGPNVGHESPYGILLGPWKLNHDLQLNGIEAFIGEFGTPRAGVTFKLVVTVERYLGGPGSKYPGVEFLNSVRYEIFAVGAGINGRERLLRQEIQVNEPDNPNSKYEIGAPLMNADIGSYLANPAAPIAAKAAKGGRRSLSDIPKPSADRFLKKVSDLAAALRTIPKTDKKYAAARSLAKELVEAAGVTDAKYVTKEMVENIETAQVEGIIAVFPSMEKVYGDMMHPKLNRH
jgi:hypothetical protein